jgi:hypothetical protein
VDGRRVKTVRGRNVRRVTVARPDAARFRVKVVTHTTAGLKVMSTRRYDGCRKTRPRTRTVRTR